jgi:large subunit ribosomal protein L10
MNRDEKAAAIAEIAAQIDESQAVLAVDYKGISVPQAAELRAKLREADATFKIVKNSLTERAADAAVTDADALKALLQGPTALTFVRGDIATAAKAVADYGRAAQLLPFKGGLMDGAALDPDQIRAISRLPSREALYGQLVGVVASPVSGLVRTLGALLGGLAVALGQVRDKKESGEIPADEPPAAQSDANADTEAVEPAQEPDEAPAADATEQAGEGESAPEAPADTAEAPADTAEAPAGAAAEEPAETTGQTGEAPAADAAEHAETTQAEPEGQEPAKEDDDNQADVSAEAESEDAETEPTKED